MVLSTTGHARVGDWNGSVRVDYRGTTTTLYFGDLLPDTIVDQLTAQLSVPPEIPEWVTLTDVDNYESPAAYLAARRPPSDALPISLPSRRARLGVDPAADTVPPPVRTFITAYQARDVDLPDLYPPGVGEAPAWDNDAGVRPPEFQLRCWVKRDGSVTALRFAVQHFRPGVFVD